MNSGRTAAGRLDALPVVRLREELDVAGQREHGPGRLAEHALGDVVRLRHEPVARGHAGAPSSSSMRRNSSWCFSSSSVKRTSASSAIWSPSQWSAADLEDLGADEALDQAEHVGVGAALDLAQQALLVGVEERQLVDLGQPVGQELLARSRTGGRGSRRGRCPSGCAWRLRRTWRSGSSRSVDAGSSVKGSLFAWCSPVGSDARRPAR